MTLPGLDERDSGRASRTLDDQATAIRQTIIGAGGASEAEPVVIVAHSGGANAPVSLVLDQRPELVRHVVWVDSGPVASGSVFAPDAPEDLDEFPLPPFDVLGGAGQSRGPEHRDAPAFSGQGRSGTRSRAPAPGGAHERCATCVPTTLVCCSIPSAQITELADAGHPHVRRGVTPRPCRPRRPPDRALADVEPPPATSRTSSPKRPRRRSAESRSAGTSTTAHRVVRRRPPTTACRAASGRGRRGSPGRCRDWCPRGC